nr:MAG TPA: hypothetical protein [Caudoviricetes sp.]
MFYNIKLVVLLVISILILDIFISAVKLLYITVSAFIIFLLFKI